MPPIPSDVVRGGRSAPRERIRKGPASPRQQPTLGSRSSVSWTEGCGSLPELCTGAAPASQTGGRYFCPVLTRLLVAALAGVGLSLAFEPVAAPVVIPFAVAAFVLVFALPKRADLH